MNYYLRPFEKELTENFQDDMEESQNLLHLQGYGLCEFF
jgi:hypothetical protein